MFFVFNKRKIQSYLISLGTVIMLFSTSLFVANNNKTLLTSSEIVKYPINKVETEIKKVALSINCIENVDNISSLVDSLSKMKAKATFYITGELALKYPEEVKKIVNNGNELGNLSYKYVSLEDKSGQEIEKQISECTKVLEKISCTKIKTYRAPYGEYTDIIIQQAQAQNLSIVQWNIDSLDYNGLNEDEMLERINKNLSPGSIILMHNSAKNTAQSIENILHNIIEQGYEITTVSDLISQIN